MEDTSLKSIKLSVLFFFFLNVWLRTGDIVQMEEYLPRPHKALGGSAYCTKRVWWHVLGIPALGSGKQGRRSRRPSWATRDVPGQPGPYGTLCQKKIKIKTLWLAKYFDNFHLIFPRL